MASFPVAATAMPVPSRQILGLDLVRFTAATLVVLLHLSICGFGWVGVQLFFALSGILIAYTAEGATPAQFLRRRIIRLVPAAWVCATVTFVIYVSIRGQSRDLARGYINSMVFWPRGPWVDFVYWTLHIEVGFYAVVFLTLAFRMVAPVMLVFGVWSAVYDILIGTALTETWFEQLTMAKFGCFFALGVLLWQLSFRGGSAWLALAMPVLVAGCVVEISLDSALKGVPPAAPELCFWSLASLMCLSVVFRRGLWTALGALAGPIRVIGLMTYPIYLIHPAITEALSPGDVQALAPQQTVLVFIATLVFSAIVVLLVEPPLRRLIDDLHVIDRVSCWITSLRRRRDRGFSGC